MRYYLACLLIGLTVQASALANANQQPIKHEFPIGVFAAPTDSFEFLQSIGVNYVHKYGMGKFPKKLDAVKQYLDAAQKHQLKVMFDLDGRYWLKQPKGLEQLKIVVERFKSHPALGFWQLADEPSAKTGSSVAQLMPYYKMLKNEAKDIPVAIVTNWIKDWYRYTAVLDYHMVDLYPVKDQPFPHSKLDSFSKFVSSAVSIGKPVIPVAQMITWKSFSTQSHVKNLKINKFHYPNQAELRYFCYSSLAQGVKGLFFFSYARALQIDPAWVKNDFATVISDVRKFVKNVAPANQPTTKSFNKKDKIFTASWVRADVEWLVLVNAKAKVATLVHSIKNPGAAAITPWGASRKLNIVVPDDASIKLQLEPWEVVILKIVRR
jgi:hypothetical protein